MSNSVNEIEDAALLFILGYNGADSHPAAVGRRIVRAKRKGVQIICCDPRRIEAARIADVHLALNNGSNLCLVNTLCHVIVEEGLTDDKFIAENSTGFEEFKELLKKYSPEETRSITGLDPAEVRKAARMYATSGRSMILYGMGVTQFAQAVDMVRGLANMAIMTGNLGRPGVGIGPVRGQNNVQGACDMGALPIVFPGYQAIAVPENVAKFEKAWGVKLSDKPGITITQVPHYVLHEPEDKRIRAFYVFGEDPAQSDPDLGEVRQSFEKLEFVVLQDIFMNRTSQYADVILPATGWCEHEAVYTCCDRGFQRVRKLIEPVGDVLTDWEIISRVSTAMGYPMKYNNTEEIWNEVIDLCPSFTGATYEKIEKYGNLQWPCRSKDMSDAGTQYLHKDGQFATADKKAKFSVADWKPPTESLSPEFPLILSTVREVGHYSARTMTGNCRLLRNLEDEPGWVQMHPEDCRRLNVKEGELVKLVSKRGWCVTRCLPTDRINLGAVYMTYQWWIGACNDLTIGTIPSMDPVSKTPEYKFCACRVEKIDDQAWAEKYVLDEYRKIRANMGIETGKKGAAA